MDISDEERLRRSERMRQLHAEGRAGAEFGKLGGRPKKPRMSEIVAEKAREDAEAFYQRLKEIGLYDESSMASIQAIRQVREMEEQERKIEVEQEVRYEQLKRAELEQIVIGNLFELIRTGAIDFEEVIDGEIIAEREALGSGEDDNGFEGE